MDDLNELIEALMIDVAEEGIGTTAGIALLWGVFIGGLYIGLSELLTLLVSMTG